MRDPYEVLGISPDAPGGEVKRAFRRLAKQFHPDTRPPDPSADLRFREVVSAYQALLTGQSHAGAQSEHCVASRLSRLRGFHAGATTLIVFLLTVGGSVSLVALWPELSDSPPPTRHQAAQPPAVAAGASLPWLPEATTSTGWKPDGDHAAGEPAIIASAAVPKQPASDGAPGADALLQREASRPSSKAIGKLADEIGTGEPDEDRASMLNRRRPEASTNAAGDRGDRVAANPANPEAGDVPAGSVNGLAWATLRDLRLGFSLSYPADIFVTGPVQTNRGVAFGSRDGRARLVVSGSMNGDGMPLAAHRRSLMTGPYRNAVFDYTPRRAYWFVLSGILGDEIFYERVTLSCDQRTVHSWKLVYPLAERALYDRIVEEVHRRYRHGNGVGGHCREAGQQTMRAARPDAEQALSR